MYGVPPMKLSKKVSEIPLQSDGVKRGAPGSVLP